MNGSRRTLGLVHAYNAMHKYMRVRLTLAFASDNKKRIDTPTWQCNARIGFYTRTQPFFQFTRTTGIVVPLTMQRPNDRSYRNVTNDTAKISPGDDFESFSGRDPRLSGDIVASIVDGKIYLDSSVWEQEVTSEHSDAFWRSPAHRQWNNFRRLWAI